MKLDDLAQLLARAGLSPTQLRTPLGLLFEAAPRQAQATLFQAFDPTLPLAALLERDQERGLLRQLLTPEQDAQLALALRRTFAPPDPAALRSDFPASRDALTEWANAHRVAHVLTFSAIELAPQAGWLSDGRAISIADVFDSSFSAASGRSSHVRPNTVRASLWEWLQHYARELEDFRTHPASPAIVDLPFRPFLDRLEAWRAPVLSWFPRLAQERFHARLELGHDQLIVRMPVAEQTAAGLFRPTVLFPYEEHLPPSCSCRRTHCWHGSAAVDAFARWLQTAPSFYLHSLQRSLRPGHEKLFEALAAAPPLPPAPVLTRIGFRIDLNKLGGVDAHRAIDAIAEPDPPGKGKGKPRTLKARDALRGAALLSARDRRSLERLAELQRDRGAQSTRAELLRGLIGHSHVLLRENRRDFAVEVRTAPVQLEVIERPDRLEARLRLNGAPLGLHSASGWVQGDAGPLRIEPDLDQQVLWLGELPASAWSFVKALEQFGGSFPTHVAPQLMKTLEALGPVALALPPSLQGAAVPPDERLRVRVVPGHGLSLTLSLTVEPLPGELPRLPGEGPAALSSWRSEGRIHTTRDLAAERAAAAKLIHQLGLPAATDEGAALWELDAPDQVLGVLEQLQRLGDAVVIQTVGAALRVTRPLASADLHLNVRKKADWFALEGTARVEEATVPVARVLEAIRGGTRWVDLGDHQFARLSEQLVAQLAPVALSARARGEAIEVTLADAPAIEALAGQVEALHLAEGFARILERMREAKELKVKLPRNFKGTLRDYQAEGFAWLSRLAAWGAGAVLADDMGLGKTVQALALLASRAKRGPALVVAPTSVAPNWVAEARRFAPGLKLTLLRDVDRAKVISGAGPNEVLVVSWALLVQEQARLAEQHFQTLVLDEAHAMKNASTQRSRAAREIRAEFVLALSGTPIENNLGELWSLFRAVLPGLFGSHEAFRERFVVPIERHDEPTARAALKTLVQPFLLRRTKDAVASELPARTEIRLEVPLSEIEQGVYEAARREAVKQLDGLTDKGAPEARFHVLAALTRLRQLACHVGLVDPSWAGGSAKVARLNELIAELKESGHKVLVFSQFTSLLDRVEQSFAAAPVRWLRLDGSTPDRERQKRIAAFQAGEADVFLLSLKAGGTGLNLTAADYVVHLDPWWNPAVEDQASDRAHRLGQTRPVTVYRLVSKGTVEERILALHASKRALVSSVLDGTHTAGALSTKQLMALVIGGES